MSLRKAFRSRKFSKSFRKLKLSDEDQEVGATAESSATRTVLTHLRHRRRLRGRICSRSCSVRSYGEWRPARTSGLTAKKKKKKKNVVACACVCKRWKDITKEIAWSPSYSGKITFPLCLKQPPPRLRPSLQVPPLLRLLPSRLRQTPSSPLLFLGCPAMEAATQLLLPS
ncbi:hypothetical protein COP1_023011 [Malus domestica]